MPTFTLKHPIKTSDRRTVEALELRDITIGDVAKAHESKNESVIGQDLALMMNVAVDVAPDDVRKMHPADFTEIRSRLREGFLV